jgi:hypothetical protein
MSALPPKADIDLHGLERLLLAISGHLSRLRNDGKSAQRDVDARAAHCINSGHWAGGLCHIKQHQRENENFSNA